MPDFDTTSIADTVADVADSTAVDDGSVDTSVEESSTESTEPTEEAPKAEPAPSKLAAALARKRAKLREERSAFEASKADFQRQSEGFQARLREAEETRALLQQLRDDPDSVAERLGIDYNAWTLRRLKAGTPEAKIEALQAQIEADRQAREQQASQASQAQQAEAQQAAEKAFVGMIRESGDLYPETSLYDDGEVIAAADALAAEMMRGGQAVSLDAIARELESRLASLHERQRARLGAPAKVATKPPAKQASAGRTLTSRASAESTGVQRELTWAERKKLAERMLDI